MRKTLTIVVIAIASLAFTVVTDWEIFQSEAGKFQIEMPDLPAVTAQLLTSDLGELEMNVFMHEGEEGIDENILYMVSYTDYPKDKINTTEMDKAALDVYYKGAVNGSVNNLDGKLVTEKTITIFGHEAREVKVDYMNGQAIMKMQILLIENRMYALQVIALAENEGNEAQNRFFNSFELLK